MMSRLVLVLVLCSVALSTPIIKIKAVNGEKRQYCCYGVAKPFDMRAKAKQGMRALVQAGFNMRKLRIVLDIHQKAVEGKLENVEQEAENLNKRVKEALEATIKILGDATKKAAKTLSEVTAVTNDLGKLGNDIEVTKTHDMITKIRQLIEDKPVKKQADDKKDETHKNSSATEYEQKEPVGKTTKQLKSTKDETGDHRKANVATIKRSKTRGRDHNNTKVNSHDERKHEDKKLGNRKKVKTTKSKEKDQVKSKNNTKSRHPKNIIPGMGETDERAIAQNLLTEAEKRESEQVKKTRDAIEMKVENNKRAFDRAKQFLRQIQDGLLQIQNGFEKTGIPVN